LKINQIEKWLDSFNGILIEGTNFTNAQEVLDNLKTSKLKINGISPVKFFADKNFNLQTYVTALQSFIDTMKNFNPSVVADSVKLLFMKSDPSTFINNAKPDPYIAYFKYRNARDKPENIKALFELFPKKNSNDHIFEKKVLEYFDNSKNAKMSEKDVETFYDQNGWRVFSPKTYGAAQKLSWLNNKKIPWCTAADPEYFISYTKTGPLICFINDKEDLAFQFNGAEKIMDKNDKFFENVNLKDKNDEPTYSSTTFKQIDTIFSSIPQPVLTKIFGSKVYENWKLVLKNKKKGKIASSFKPAEERNGFKRFVVKTNDEANEVLSQFFDLSIETEGPRRLKFDKGETGISKNFFSRKLGIKDFKENDQLWIGKYKGEEIIAFASRGALNIYEVKKNPFNLHFVETSTKENEIKNLLTKKDGADRGKEQKHASMEELKSGKLYFSKRDNAFEFTFRKETELKIPNQQKVSRFNFQDHNTTNEPGIGPRANVKHYNEDIEMKFYNEKGKIKDGLNGDFEEFKKLNPEIWQELKSSNIVKKYWIELYRDRLRHISQKGDAKIYRTIKEELLGRYRGKLI
jgi:hypothetical protein